ncbi:MAG: hypothetical protein JO356_12800 [Acidobacteria bacterium]|nr:hypothetical protein [Acidobacteriota bacterium]
MTALCLHGYHPYAEDAEIYLPGIERILHPELFPVGREFFASHASLTVFPNLIALSVRLTHLPLAYALLAWQLAAILLLLIASWQFSATCFLTPEARWAAVGTMAALLTLPVAGTALYIIDQYLNPRNLAAVVAIFATTRVLQGRLVRAALWLGFGFPIHPLMTCFAALFSALLLAQRKFDDNRYWAILLFPVPHLFVRPTPAYHEAMRFHISHFITHWQWYEWLGVVAPVAIFYSIQRLARQQECATVRWVARALVIYNLGFFVLALVISIPKAFEALARIQPLRSLHLLYMLLILIGGGLMGQQVLKRRVGRWLIFFVPLCAGMYWAQRTLFPASAHIEWPWRAPRNPWTQAFVWIQSNTPVDALFAIDPFYNRIPGEDTVGFRACAERSRLADAAKDSGAVSMFPPLAERWWDEFEAQRNWSKFQKQDFINLQRRYGVEWVVLAAPVSSSFDCPYKNPAVAVCKLAP